MRNLITGGAGFIGSHLAEYLLAKGDKVHIIDDLSTGSINNIAHLKENKDFSYTIDTVTDEQLVAEWVDWSDFVYHLAAAVGVELIVKSPVATIETNIRGTEVVLQQASKKNRPVLITSTSETYGKSEDLPFREDADMVFGAMTYRTNPQIHPLQGAKQTFHLGQALVRAHCVVCRKNLF